MTFTELNQKGDFDSWDKTKLAEIRDGKFSDTIGKLLYENKEIKVWEIVLRPTERLPFRRHKNSYSCTSFTDGLLVSRNINGQAELIRSNNGDSFFWDCTDKEMVHDLENVGENTVKIIIVEEIRNIENM